MRSSEVSLYVDCCWIVEAEHFIQLWNSFTIEGCSMLVLVFFMLSFRTKVVITITVTVTTFCESAKDKKGLKRIFHISLIFFSFTWTSFPRFCIHSGIINHTKVSPMSSLTYFLASFPRRFTRNRDHGKIHFKEPSATFRISLAEMPFLAQLKIRIWLKASIVEGTWYTKLHKN